MNGYLFSSADNEYIPIKLVCLLEKLKTLTTFVFLFELCLKNLRLNPTFLTRAWYGKLLETFVFDFFSKQYIDKQNTKIFGWPFAVCKEEKKQQTEWIAFFTFFYKSMIWKTLNKPVVQLQLQTMKSLGMKTMVKLKWMLLHEWLISCKIVRLDRQMAHDVHLLSLGWKKWSQF